MNKPRAWPTEIRLNPDKTVLHVSFDSNDAFALEAEYLRVESPSAEVKGHGPSQEKTVPGKRNVSMTALEPIGNYALKITFSDGHDTGLYSWDYLHKLGSQRDDIWFGYLAKLEAEGLSRD